LGAEPRRASRRSARSLTDAPVRGGDLELLVDRAVVLRRGQELPLTRTEFRLLCELAEHPGTVKTREELLHNVWGYDYFGDTRLLDVHVRRLPRKIEDDPGARQLVLTGRGVGYGLASAPVAACGGG
jgi:DNA-binding response OmpR family regulator